jgi:ribosome-associated toxin RatA of RatAB toxin-antitoxin module
MPKEISSWKATHLRKYKKQSRRMQAITKPGRMLNKTWTFKEEEIFLSDIFFSLH